MLIDEKFNFKSCLDYGRKKSRYSWVKLLKKGVEVKILPHVMEGIQRRYDKLKYMVLEALAPILVGFSLLC